MTEPAVRVDAITKSFGDVHAVRGISFEVPRGSVLGILGPNGAGKTTLVDILSTLITPDSGSATVAGHDVARHPGGVREAISMTGQYAALDETLGGRDNLIFFGRMQGLRRGAARERADHLLEQFDLAEFGKRPVFSYSGGMRRRLDIACGLVIRPEVVFLDEPTTGLDPRSRQAVWALVEALKADGITTLLTTQYLEEADRLSDNIIVLDKGRVVAEGTAEQLKQKVGGAYCEVVLDDPSRSDEMCGLLRTRLAVDPRPTVGDDTTITLSTTDGVETMGAVIAIAKDAGIRLTDVGLRNPSLDDVFLTLTGSPSGTTEDSTR
ncbi:UNVERIFIED_ORG: ABC-2 type transport system ATP-binding protein [Gordonia westfalica J30]